ncbi:PRC-barrel domain-containing protein [Aminobacter aganoensis]|uniref:Sporulation protein YlmC with PRC-barrel domain n=1 Tax=Aminobacter aganoensis TaxID=83264 RepID=A0A7X0KNG3_9HYPH|nr:PRC-barrel domain-containing protein [Aminobacter aganoensis]MBB6357148.1 sporulation protein YlmC with PRC-barrel domain [Aminobacter aganoensis]
MNNLIESDKVIGTEVYGPDGAHIGEVERLILEKVDGRVAHAVLSFGGFLGMAQDRYPLPWNKLTYNEDLGGFQVDITREQIDGAPTYNGDGYDWSEENNRRIYDHYGAQPYW